MPDRDMLEGLGYAHVPGYSNPGRVPLPPLPADVQKRADALGANPKDIIGDTKPNLTLVPDSAIIQAARVMGLGAKKYGPFNWRSNKVRLSVYIGAAKRHLAALFDGENNDPESGAPHEAHVLSCMAILLDAAATGNLVDDRPKGGASARLLAKAAAVSDLAKSASEDNSFMDHLRKLRSEVSAMPIGGVVEVSRDQLNSLTAAALANSGRAVRAATIAPSPRRGFLWYVATPYTASPHGPHEAHSRAVGALRELLARDIAAFCPIAHSHNAGHGLPKNHDFWMKVDHPFMDRCDGLLIVRQDGWSTSRGIDHERETFKAAGKPVIEVGDVPNWDGVARELRRLAGGRG